VGEVIQFTVSLNGTFSYEFSEVHTAWVGPARHVSNSWQLFSGIFDFLMREVVPLSILLVGSIVSFVHTGSLRIVFNLL
jgi:hypothetical protein